MTPRITLEPLHVDYADRLAVRRQRSAEARKRPARNGAPTDRANSLGIHIVGARAEAAAKLYLNPVKWNAFAERGLANLPDLEDFIEVKGRTKAHYGLIVQRGDQEHWAYLLVCTHLHPVYLIVGWAWGHEAKRPEFWKDPHGGRPAFFPPNSILKPPAELLAEVRRRQTATANSRQ